ncbi:hypothetical protein EII14_06865 [Alloprevotella sp. OH1205_COT-284]|uniref:hypothetical protein n=1 Tax=Alloprevotella sp. OH1205_COT-284 TaxID=2491043 RepID=UPI000F5EC18D|nr:hypothetical protein [Alloprevotella sp. OH1205_COT-284]RRD78252.1 hypothetical protein EII14_06865 [Alloprevotella sp. OH1205_COT-284]
MENTDFDKLDSQDINTIQTDSNVSSNDTLPTPPQKKKRKLWISFFLLFVLGVGGGVLYYFYEQENEASAYRILENNENIEDYETFLQKYPHSDRAEQVKERLTTLRAMYAEWQRLSKSEYAKDFERFIKNYPNSILVKQCEVKIDSLDWIEAVMANTPEAIERYLQKHPEGRYLAEASAAQEAMRTNKVDDSEISLIAATLERFFQAYANNDDASLCTCITPVMTKFLTKSNVTKAEVVDIVARTYSEYIRNCSFVLNNDYVCTKSTAEDGTIRYKVNFTVDQHIDRDNEGKIFGSYTAHAELTEQFKLSSLELNEVSRKEKSDSAYE